MIDEKRKKKKVRPVEGEEAITKRTRIKCAERRRRLALHSGGGGAPRL